MTRWMLGVCLGLTMLAGAGPAPAAPPPLATYGKLPALELVRLSPSGNRIAFIAVDGENRRLFVRNVGGEAILVNPVGANKVRDITWAGEDYVLVEASATAKFGNGKLDKWSYSTRAELAILIVVNLKTHQVRKMFDHKELDVLFGAIDQKLGAYQLDGRWYQYVHAYSADKGGNIFKVDLETDKYTILTRNIGDEFAFFIDVNGALAAHTFYDEDTKTWRLLMGEHGEQIITKRVSPLYTAGMAGGGRTPGTILVSDQDEQRRFWDEYPLTPGATPTRLFDGLELSSLMNDPVTGVLLGGILEDGHTGRFFDPAQQRRFDAIMKAFPGYHVDLISASQGLTRLVVETSGGDDSGTFWLVDMTTGKADELTAAYPAIGPKDVGPTRMFAWKAADGLPIEGVLTLPPGSSGKGLPVVVMPHGGPIGVHDHLGFDWWAQAFASRGYAVLQPNYRGSDGYGLPFQNKGMGEWGGRMLTDMSDGLAALTQAGIAAPGRACIVGASYGGYAALAGVTVQQGLYRCAVSVSGPSDVGAVMAADGDSDYSPGGRYSQKLFGVRSAGDAALGPISPLRRAKRADAPILLIHGKDDTVVPFVHSLSMNTALKDAGKTVRFVATEGEDHWLSKEATRVQTLEESVGWVEQYNPAAPPAP